MSAILILLILLFCILVIFWFAYIALRKINEIDNNKYFDIELQCQNPDCDANTTKEFSYHISINDITDKLPCPTCNKTRQILSEIENK